MFILLVTARADTADLEQALEAGANDYLTKPLDLGLLNVRLSVAERQIRELAERNDARAALQESARTMANILENTTDGFLRARSRMEIYLLERRRPKRSWHAPAMNFRRGALGKISRADRIGFRDQLSESHGRPGSGGIRSERCGRRRSGTKCTPIRATAVFRFFSAISANERRIESGAPDDKQTRIAWHPGRWDCARPEQHSDRHFREHRAGSNRSPGGLRGVASFLSKAGQAAQHAAHLSSQLLTFSKGGAPLKKVVSVSRLLEQAGRVFALRIEPAR